MALLGWASLAVLLFPILVMASRAFSLGDEFSTQAFSGVASNPLLLRGLANSLAVASSAAVVAVALAFGLHSLEIMQPQGPRILNFRIRRMLFPPLLVPDLVLGLLYALAFHCYGLRQGLLAIFLAYIVTGIPLAYLVLDFLSDIRMRDLACAARDLGVGSASTILTILLPISRPSLIGAAALLFMLYLNEYVIASFLAGPSSQTLPLVIYGSIRFGIDAATCAVISMVITAAMVLAGMLMPLIMPAIEGPQLTKENLP